MVVEDRLSARPRNGANGPVEGGIVSARADALADEDQDPLRRPSEDPEGMGAEDAWKAMSEMFWSLARALMYGLGKTLQYGGIPFLLAFIGTWYVGQRTATELVQLSESEKAQALVLDRALDGTNPVETELAAAGVSQTMLRTQRKRLEESAGVEAKAAAALEYTGLLNEQLSHLPTPSDPEGQMHRRELALALTTVERDAQRYVDLERSRVALQESTGGKCARLLHIRTEAD